MESDTNATNASNHGSVDDDFVKKILEQVEANYRNEQFSVEELADRMGMSRSHLHRKLKKATGQSINQFIREYRLRCALEMLKKDNLTVAEIAYQVGFSAPSYFTFCFTGYYGYPPGEARHKLKKITQSTGYKIHQGVQNIIKEKRSVAIGGLVILVLAIAVLLYGQLVTHSDDLESFETLTGNSIAVLPFKNLNTDQKNEYFVEGVVEAINRHLSSIGDLKVISVTSADRYRESNKSAHEIGKELKAANLLEGSIQRDESMVRIEVRLVNALTETQIWAENYDRELKDIFNTQSEIAEKVVLALKAKLPPEEKAVLNQQVTEYAQAYDLYLKGIYEYRTYTRNGNLQAIEYFEQAIALDSNFALAYAGLGGSQTARASMFGSELRTSEAMALAKPYLDKALTLNPDLVSAHCWKGFYLLYNDWDFEGAEQEYKKAIITNDPDGFSVYIDYLNFTKRHQEALMFCEKFHRVHPYFPNSRMILTLFFLERYDEATEFAQSRIELFNNYYTWDNYGFLMLNTGNYLKAIDIFQKIIEIEDVRYPRILGWMGAAYARSGQKEHALELLEELKVIKTQTDAGAAAFFIAAIYAAMDDRKSALYWLQESYESHEMEMPWLITEPQFYTLHDEPAFQNIVNKVGFPAIHY